MHPHAKCADCEFQCSDGDDLKSGFKECWQTAFGWTEADFNDPNILEIWNFRRKPQLLEELRPKIKDLTIEDFDPTPDGRPGISSKER